MIHTIVYVSRSNSINNKQSVEDIRLISSTQNEKVGITGILLWTNTYFCQLLQGPKDALDETMQRILRDNRHSKPLIILRTNLSEPLFPDWSLATKQISLIDDEVDFVRLHEVGHATPKDIESLISYMQMCRYPDRISSPNKLPLEMWPETNIKEAHLQNLLDIGSASLGNMPLVLVTSNNSQWQPYACSGVDRDASFALMNHSALQGLLAKTKTRNFETPTHSLPLAHQEEDLQSYIDVAGLYGYDQSGELENESTVALGSILSVGETPLDEQGLKDLQRVAMAVQNFICTEHASHSNESLKHRSRRNQFSLSSIEYGTLNTIFHELTCAVLALDNKTRILYSNKFAHGLLGIEHVEEAQQWPSHIKLRNPTTHEIVDTDYFLFSKESNTFLLENSISDQARYISIETQQVKDANTAIKAVVIINDVTEHELTRERVRRGDRLEALGQLTSGIAHDFNNLLATIQKAIELADYDSEERERFLKLALGSIDRGSQMTNRLMLFGSANKVQAEIHSVKSVLEDVHNLIASSLASNITLNMQDVSNTVGVYCDRGQLENALLNLLINSKDALSDNPDGRIELSISEKPAGILSDQQGDWIYFTVTDNGAGMSSSVLRQAVYPFFSTRKQTDGVGLGLSMVYQFARQSGGEFTLNNNVNTQNKVIGAVATIKLHKKLMFPNQSDMSISTVTQKALPTEARDGTHILVVEDDELLGSLLSKSLELRGFKVCNVSDPKSAIETLHKHDIDLLITDIVMPGDTDGVELARLAQLEKPDLSVIYLTGYARNKKALQVSPVLQKPVATDILLQNVENLLDARGSGASALPN